MTPSEEGGPRGPRRGPWTLKECLVKAQRSGGVRRQGPLVFQVTKQVTRRVFGAFYRIDLGREGGEPLHGPTVILPKHQYWTDIPFVSFAFESYLYFVAKKELFRYPLVRNFVSALGGIPVDREESIRTLDSFKRVLALLKAGESIVLFPEGTYVREGVGPGKSRLIRMILRSQPECNGRIAFVPVGIRYGKRAGWRRSVEVRVGRPLFADGESEATLLTDRVMEEIGRLCNLPRGSAQKG